MCSLSEALFKAVLVEKINNFREREDYVSRIGTMAIGNTNSSQEENVFVLLEEVRSCHLHDYLHTVPFYGVSRLSHIVTH